MTAPPLNEASRVLSLQQTYILAMAAGVDTYGGQTGLPQAVPTGGMPYAILQNDTCLVFTTEQHDVPGRVHVTLQVLSSPPDHQLYPDASRIAHTRIWSVLGQAFIVTDWDGDTTEMTVDLTPYCWYTLQLAVWPTSVDTLERHVITLFPEDTGPPGPLLTATELAPANSGLATTEAMTAHRRILAALPADRDEYLAALAEVAPEIAAQLAAEQELLD